MSRNIAPLVAMMAGLKSFADVEKHLCGSNGCHGRNAAEAIGLQHAALFRSVTQRSEENRGTPWKDILR